MIVDLDNAIKFLRQTVDDCLPIFYEEIHQDIVSDIRLPVDIFNNIFRPFHQLSDLVACR